MRTLFSRVGRLTVSDYATVAEIVTIAVAIELSLRCLPFSRVHRFVKGHTEDPESTGRGGAETRSPFGLSSSASQRLRGYVTRIPNPEVYFRLVQLTAGVYRVLRLPDTCLRQSLVLCALLNRRGARASLRLGVTKDGAALSAHAWVDCEGIESQAAGSPFRELRRVADVA